ncbi:hypothetical protein FIBSPDRAFT_912396 [Athelia psychrophila]|uniref:Peptidase C14 caspase domain-containing protein n=1 Tax=Athelia psychrophila TaxID=1759441 RepID=A0A166EJ88_9AGAM|nr:hypothetical protein FIBSPDRAFT_912396 [Fibularhizoctonia sp. CBS 109695]
MFLSFANAFVQTYTEIFWYFQLSVKGRRPYEYVANWPPKPPHVVPPSGSTTPLHALVIGINKYANIKQLKGCVADADAVEEFLRNELKVPQSQITSLRDAKASRSAMVQAFRDLANHPDIKMDDPILIFFAGHGSELAAPQGWEAGGLDSKIQGLIPQDYDSRNLPLVHVIPDRTVGALINEMSRKKGNNITIIFDCCHSGSGTRKGESSVQRTVKLLDNLPANLDSDLLHESGARGDIVAPGSFYKGLDSHVLLAACGAKETADEDGPPPRGLFTTALIKLLQDEGVDKLVYTDVLKRIDAIPNQNPQCEGTNSNRIFFNAKCPPARRLTYPVRREGDEYKLDAGAAHGISVGAEFNVYANEKDVLTASPLGSLVVGDAAAVKAFDTAMTLPSGCSSFAVDKPAVALQTKLGAKEDFALHVPLHEDLIPVFETLSKEMQTPGPDTARIKLVEDRDQAMLEIVMDEGKLYFNILDKRITVHGVNRIHFPFDPELDSIRPVLRAAAHYYWHLNRASNTDQHFQERITVEFFELYESETELDDAGDSILRPDTNPENLYTGSTIKFTVKPNAPYGMRITNNTAWDLYPGVFYFDSSDLSIVPYYVMSSSGKFKADSPLKKHGGTFTIGYGSTATRPRYFGFRHGHDIDIGFLKMFFTTDWVDLTKIPQKSPFRTGRFDDGLERPPAPKWGTILIPIVQHRRK